MKSLADYPLALAAALAGVQPLGRSDIRPLEDCDRCSLAEIVVADRDLPPFNRSQMDGYALRAADFQPNRPFPVIRSIAAGHQAGSEIPVNSCVAVATGAPIPPGLDTVIQHEVSDRKNPVTFTLNDIRPGHAVHHRAADARAGSPLLTPPLQLAPHHLAIAAAVGKTHLKLFTPPTVTMLTSGDEVVPVENIPRDHQIRNSNAALLRPLLRRFGADPIAHDHLVDDLNATCAAVQSAIHSADILITVGGVSAGDRDHFPSAFDKAGVTTILRGANIQPGRPIFIGCAPGGCIVIGLPGNPVSALATSCLFAWPIIRAL
ncbi:MAG TPA: molybdopterin molybdotransferase MoeA, partial [Phycisphaerales bacterium]|nr:molybdopterin molybdotransferase MoeA [Phycisphaerales bacterium]